MLNLILCLSLAAAVSAVPASKFFNYLPHYGNPMPSGANTKVANEYIPPLTRVQQGMSNSPVSMEIMLPAGVPGKPVRGPGVGSAFPAQGYIKYSLPKAPGAKSVEIYYPFDIRPQEVMPNMNMMPNMNAMPQPPYIPQIFPFNFPPQTAPQPQPPMQVVPPQMVESPQQMQIQQDQKVPVGQP